MTLLFIQQRITHSKFVGQNNNIHLITFEQRRSANLKLYLMCHTMATQRCRISVSNQAGGAMTSVIITATTIIKL